MHRAEYESELKCRLQTIENTESSSNSGVQLYKAITLSIKQTAEKVLGKRRQEFKHNSKDVVDEELRKFSEEQKKIRLDSAAKIP